jgi:hypothetical protein
VSSHQIQSSNAPLELSHEKKEKLARLDELKSVYKAIFHKAAENYAQGRKTSASESYKSPLEQNVDDFIRPSEFSFAWEWIILPFLIEILPDSLGRGYAINVMLHTEKECSTQIICFTSKVKPTRTRRMIIARHVLDIIPARFYKTTSFRFYRGMVEFLQTGTNKKNQDDVCDPRNPYFYLLPMMGDSIGPSEEEAAATLGPCLQFGDEVFWLANLHVFLKQIKRQGGSP